MSEADVVVYENSAVVRPAMMQNIAHRDEPSLIYISPRTGGVRNAVDAAHIVKTRVCRTSIGTPTVE